MLFSLRFNLFGIYHFLTVFVSVSRVFLVSENVVMREQYSSITFPWDAGI